ncbi:DUF5324 family protein [Kitasatospora sp. MAP5-34]|uniref:DUF5324 family protein n=1 Tax=Kitasatospora sp. MAP5-34 TaxID=3035102 RepID=UPI002476ECC5|nr:DUF5324 family protein [Kitasatospora sp. MAP5-34]MDH6576406.1 hypothetical protein [Kitasatospora sp. MAP5-34]
MTRLDSARETAEKTRDTLAPYATTARHTALHYADEAMQRFGPALEALGPKVGSASTQARTGAANAAHAARVQYVKRVAPQLEQAFFALPPQTQQSTLKAVHRAQEAALAAKHSASKAAETTRSSVVPKVTDKVTDAVDSARSVITPVAHEAQLRGSAALTALHGHVSAAEISDLAARNARKEQRSGWATGLAVAGTLAVGTGVIAWQWWRRQSAPEWLVEPSAGQDTPYGTAGGSPMGDSMLNGSHSVSSNPNPAPTPDPDPAPDPEPGHPAPGDRPKPHDPRKPH